MDTRTTRIYKQTGIVITKVVAVSALLLALLWPTPAANAQKSKALPTQANSATVDWPNTGFVMDADAYIKAAMELQAMGKDKACTAMMARAKLKQFPLDNMDVIILCRMLFVAKPGGEFRRPMIGGAVGFPGHTSYSDWPLEPIAISDGVPILIVSGYELAGRAEPPAMYLEYCMASCDWNSYRYTPKTKAEERQALVDLLNSPRLKGKISKQDKEDWENSIR